MYGGSPYSRTIVNQNTIDLPVVAQAPLRRQHVVAARGTGCHVDWKTFGFVLCFLSAASLALGVADVVYTWQTYMTGKSCSSNTSPNYCNPNVLLFTWIAVGIWASAFVFYFGLYLVCYPIPSKTLCREMLLILCALVFAPALVVISALEVYKGVSVFYWTASQLPSDDVIKAAIPLTIAGLGFLEFCMCVFALYYSCCCVGQVGSTVQLTSPPVTTGVMVPSYAPAPMVPSYSPPSYPTYERPSCTSCVSPPKPACQTCPQTNYAPFYNRGNMGARPAVYSPNPAYSFYRS